MKHVETDIDTVITAALRALVLAQQERLSEQQERITLLEERLASAREQCTYLMKQRDALQIKLRHAGRIEHPVANADVYYPGAHYHPSWSGWD